jgi:hypothetical protein
LKSYQFTTTVKLINGTIFLDSNSSGRSRTMKCCPEKKFDLLEIEQLKINLSKDRVTVTMMSFILTS